MLKALRSLRRTPAFTIAVLVSLVLGVGSAAAMFAIVYGVLLAPLPYGDPDRLVSVSLKGAERGWFGQPPAIYLTYKRHAQKLVDIGLYRTGNSNVWTTRAGDVAESVRATWVTASMMSLLQFNPLLGRTFSADEEVRGGPDAVILSEAEWRSRFDAAPDVIGQTLIVNSVTRQIVGVMPASFAFPNADTRIWLPVKYTDSATVSDFSNAAIARLAPGVSAEQAQAELAAVLPRTADAFPQLESGGSTATWLAEQQLRPVVLPLREVLTGPIASTLWMLAAAAGLVLLVAWANVINLLLIRADSRQLELAVRAALGAGRLRLASHFLGEAVCLSATAGALALLLAHVAVRALVAYGPANIPRLAELGVGPMTVGFVLVLSIVGAIICAAAPVLPQRHASLSIKLGDGARGQSVGKSRQRLRATITVLQIALALVVSVGSALLLRTANQLAAVHPGFDARNVTLFRATLPLARYDAADGLAFYTRLVERASQLPGVRAAGVAGRVPLSAGEPRNQEFRIEGEGRTVALPMNAVDAGYFAAMRIPLLAGRQLAPQAQRTDLIISQRAAMTVFGDASGISALGKQLTMAPTGPTYTVVGVVGDVREQDLATPSAALVYQPALAPIEPGVAVGTPRPLALVVSADAPAGTIVPAIRQIVGELDPTVPIFSVQTMDEVMRASTARLSLMLTLMATAALITLALGAIGLYAVMTYMVALRTREFGIRIALGADPRQIVAWVARRGLLLTLIGVGFGLVLHAMTAPFLRAFLYGVSTTDPWTLMAATLVLLGTASLASWMPARRAARVNPVVALRAP